MTRQETILSWYRRAQVDYIFSYMSLYAAFNAWYGAGGMTNDRQVITMLREPNIIWESYRQGDAMRSLSGYMVQLVEYTQREPLSYTSPHWRGVVPNIYDWSSLLEYWYRVRCLVMHGSEINPQYVYLAYQTLNIVMGEIIQRGATLNTVYNTGKKGYN